MGFKNKEIDAALKMFGNAEDRAMPHPLQHCGSDMMHSGGWNKMRSMNSPGTVGNDVSYNKAEKLRSHPVKNISIGASKAAYNAMDVINQIKNQLNPTSKSYHGNVPAGSSSMGSSVNLPSPNIQNFNSGSYSNPQSTTSSNANDNSNTINPYSFMDDENLKKDTGEHKNKFGFNKRNEKSIQARIDDAIDKGKTAKEARLRKKMKNFQDNQNARAGGNIIDKINPKNWL
tara:strand:+ start:2433 stop:3122 length:690 start_codon:yes stop_codon:yes gene_type:complete